MKFRNSATGIKFLKNLPGLKLVNVKDNKLYKLYKLLVIFAI